MAQTRGAIPAAYDNYKRGPKKVASRASVKANLKALQKHVQARPQGRTGK